MILTRPVWWKRVKGDLECSAVVEANDVGAQSQEEAEISQLAVFVCGVKLRAGGIRQGARYGSSEERQTFQVILFGCLGGGGWSIVSREQYNGGMGRHTVLGDVHLSLLGLGLLDGLEQLCVDALGAGLMRGTEHAGAQLGAVRLFAACTCAFGHCVCKVCWVEFLVVWMRASSVAMLCPGKVRRGKVRRGILGGERASFDYFTRAPASARRLVTLTLDDEVARRASPREPPGRRRRHLQRSPRAVRRLPLRVCPGRRCSALRLCHPLCSPEFRKPRAIAGRQEAGTAQRLRYPPFTSSPRSRSHSAAYRLPPIARAESNPPQPPMLSRADINW
jgi:hypothetical protein